jgi:hypothetical protein
MRDFTDLILGLVTPLLHGLAPTDKKHRLWYLIIGCLIIVACSLCGFLVDTVVQSRRMIHLVFSR